MALAEVKTLYESNYRDVPKTLRLIADEIEAGKHGEVIEGIVVIHSANGVECFGQGDSEIKSAFGLLELAKRRLYEIWDTAVAAVKAGG